MAEKKSGHIDGANKTKSEFPQESVQGTENIHLQTRRRLIQVGLMSLPVLITVRSRPAFAQSLGSVSLPYGAYLVDTDGHLVYENNSLIPIKVNEDGLPINEVGQVIDPINGSIEEIYQQQILNDPTRRHDLGSISYAQYLGIQDEDEPES